MDKHVPILDIINGHATVETKGLYRVVFHNIDSERTREIYGTHEFLSAEEAIRIAQSRNDLALYCHGKDALKSEVWAEAISYDSTEKRWERSNEQADEDEREASIRAHEHQRWKKKTRKLRKRLKRLKAAK